MACSLEIPHEKFCRAMTRKSLTPNFLSQHPDRDQLRHKGLARGLTMKQGFIARQVARDSQTDLGRTESTEVRADWASKTSFCSLRVPSQPLHLLFTMVGLELAHVCERGTASCALVLSGRVRTNRYGGTRLWRCRCVVHAPRVLFSPKQEGLEVTILLNSLHVEPIAEGGMSEGVVSSLFQVCSDSGTVRP